MKLLIALPLLFWGSGQVRAQPRTADFAREQRETGAKLKYFDQLDQGVYKGSKPTSEADYRFLQSLGVKYIVDIQNLPFTYRFERGKARKYGMHLILGHMNASPFSPSEKHVDAILAILRDARYHPVYFHCALGRDRTSLIAALYEMYFLGMSPKQADRYLHESGYKDGWDRSGLTRYLRKHPNAPAALLSIPQAR